MRDSFTAGHRLKSLNLGKDLRGCHQALNKNVGLITKIRPVLFPATYLQFLLTSQQMTVILLS